MVYPGSCGGHAGGPGSGFAGTIAAVGTPENRMALPPAPIKTPAGQEELSHRVRRLSQRHRTVLLLVDGRRSQSEVLQLAAQAGVPDSCYDELLTLGLIELPPADSVAHVDLPLAGASAAPRESTGQQSTVAGAYAMPAADDDAPINESELPEAEPLVPESVWTPAELADAAAGLDRPLEEAREILLRALRNEAPVSGALTARKLRRVSTRAELEELLDEVEQRIRKPRKMIVTAQTLRHVRHLLSLPVPA